MWNTLCDGRITITADLDSVVRIVCYKLASIYIHYKALEGRPFQRHIVLSIASRFYSYSVFPFGVLGAGAGVKWDGVHLAQNWTASLISEGETWETGGGRQEEQV